MSGKDKIISKIKKCLALAKSANANEAATALRQAQALMEQHGIDESDVLASEAGEAHAKSTVKMTPPAWESLLASVVADALGCNRIYYEGVTHSRWIFVGIGPKCEIAAYAFSVLLRQLKKARSDFIKRKLKRCLRATKIRRADEFCIGWVIAVSVTVRAFARSDEDTAIINAYLAKRFGGALVPMESRKAKAGRDYGDAWAGHRAGRDVTLNHGVGSLDGAQGRLGYGG